MKILVVGSGGREHALAWKLAQADNIQKVYVAPGNGGTALDKRLQNINIIDITQLLQFAIDEQIAFTIVGPEAPLALGIVDIFRANNLLIFGPTKKAAQLESSKAYAKDFMTRHNIPTAFYQTFTNNIKAKDYIKLHGAPIVIKDDGLAAGKGVVVAMELEQALNAVDNMLDINEEYNINNNKKIVIEEYLTGEEASFIVMADGKNILPLATSQDHKRLKDGDIGPNTGGMGAYSPAPVVTPQIHAKIMREIIEPTIKGMEKDGIPYTGFLYAGVMIDNLGNPKTLEFNCRMGDPETQPIMARIKNNLVDVFKLALEQKLDTATIEWDRRYALGVVIASQNYPDTPKIGDAIHGLSSIVNNVQTNENTPLIFHAGTTYNSQNKQVITNGGRVLCIVGLGDSVKQAKKHAYDAVNAISFEGMHYRNDIGYHAIKN